MQRGENVPSLNGSWPSVSCGNHDRSMLFFVLPHVVLCSASWNLTLRMPVLDVSRVKGIPMQISELFSCVDLSSLELNPTNLSHFRVLGSNFCLNSARLLYFETPSPPSSSVQKCLQTKSNRRAHLNCFLFLTDHNPALSVSSI